MPQVTFTAHLRRLAPPSPVEAVGDTVADALASVFANHPLLETYILDDQRRLRRHIALFVDGERARLADPVSPGARIAVLQALSGG